MLVYVQMIPRGRWLAVDTVSLSLSRCRFSDCRSRPLTAIPVSCVDGWAGLKRSRVPAAWLRLGFSSPAEELDYLGLRLGLVTKTHA